MSSLASKAVSLLGAAVLVLASPSCEDVFCGSSPFLTSLAPSSTVAGGLGLQLTVTGDGFHFDSLVLWNGSGRVTHFIDHHHLVAVIGASDIATAGSASIAVFTPPGGTNVVGFSGASGLFIAVSCGGGTSNPLPFTIGP